MQHRREMIQHIVKLLKQKDKNASQEWLNKLPQMVKQLEVSLYRSAPSFEAYADTSTLKHRLQLLAMEIARKTQQAKDQNPQQQERRRSDHQQQPYPNGMHTPQHQGMGQRQGSHGGTAPYGGPSSTSQLPSPSSVSTPSQDPHQQMVQQRQQQMAAQRQRQQQRGSGGRQVVNMDEINPMMGGSSTPSAAMGSSNGPLPQQNSVSGTGSGSVKPSVSFMGPSSGSAAATGGSSGRNVSASSNASSSHHGNKNDPEWQIRIRHKQQRLLLLHHSSKCPHEDGRCTVTPHCADMKRLWKHMARCTDNNCRVSHCFSSRSILSHYRKCKDARCPACGPVRETVRKTQSKSSGSSSRWNNRSSDAASQRNSSAGSQMMNQMMGNMAYPAQNQTPSAGSSSSQQQQMNLMTPASDGMGSMPGGAGAPFQQQRQSSQGGMPPPMSGPSTGGNMPYNVSMSTPFRSSSSNGGTPGHGQHASSGMQPPSVQPLFHSDQQNSSQSSVVSSGGRSPLDASSSTPFAQSTPSGGSGGGGSGGSGQHSRRNDADWQNKVRHKQQRLLLLRHASKCQYENGQCPVTPHCASMKKLWKHIADCKDQQCKVQHCMSSRYVLSHYRRCKDARCPACGPVRETIRKSHEKERGKQQLLPFDGQFGVVQDDPNPMSVDPMLNEQNRSATKSLSPSDQQSAQLNVPSSGGVSPTDSYQPQTKKPKTQHDSSSSAVGVASAAVVSDGTNAESSFAGDQPIATPSQPAEEVKSSRTPKENDKAGSDSSSTPKLQTPAAQPIGTSSAATPVTPTKPMEDHSLINSFTVEQIETHIASLNRTVQLSPAKLKTKCLEVLKGLQNHNHGWVFNCPVDPVELGLPDYFDIIKHPMDLGTIQKKLDAGAYHSIEDFSADARLTFDNAMTYNEEGSVVHDMAKELKAKFLTDYEKLLAQLKAEEKERRQNDRACHLCGCEKLLFEPPVFFCNGLNCPSKRIRRNSHYYSGGSNQYYWCNQCYNELDDSMKIELVDLTIKKADLKKKKNDEVHEESWVQCDSCERWIHQICGLFNTRQNKEHKSEYCCPQCLLAKRKKGDGKSKPLPHPPSADDLPRTKLSEWLERHVREKVENQKAHLGKEKADLEKISMEEALKSMDFGGPVTIRQVTSTDRKLEVRERMKRRYAHKNYPDEFPFRCKCIVVFQNIDGVDVILFALYVYEHGENNPAPNKRTVYISYLDSVHFMRPRKMRTFVYHEILISYLDYARQKGFLTAHIWACPPLKGDDYIFYAKPEDQRTPKDARLRQWYIEMLTECQKRDIVGKVTNMYDLYFANEKLDGTAVPYLEGDYFPGEAENIIKDLAEGGGKKSGSSGKKSKKKRNNGNGGGSGSSNKAKSKSKAGRGGTRSGGIDEEALAASKLIDGPATLSYKEGGRDPVMAKLGEIIQPMKESFIVAFLNCSDANEEDMVVPKEILEYRETASKGVDGEGDDPVIGSATSLSKKRDADGNPRVVSIDSIKDKELKDRNGRLIKILDDDLEEMDCEFFNNRQAFLNLCKGNHYQFDELRRSKHTSMMVLWHLHNRDAPKFVQQCASCSREILTGIRHHCSTCTDFDLCDECFKNPKTNRGSCTHKLEPISVESTQEGQSNGGSEITEAQRKERQRNIQLHIQLIEHASRCNSPTCSSSNCAKMKSYLKHGQTCKLKASGGCKICKRIWTLLRIHAQQCKNAVCPIPQCMAIRERIRQLAKQQQAMDDRRRQEMNRHYRMGMGGNG